MKKQYFVWGQNNFGQLGIGSNVNKQIFTPTEAYQNASWRSISIGQNFVVGVLNDGTLWAWGSNFSGIFGEEHKLTDFFLNPICLSTDTTWDSVCCGKKHVLALKFHENGKKELFGWGDNAHGQLGINKKTQFIYTPVNLISKHPNLPRFWKSIAAGVDHSLALDENGYLFGTGNNTSGQLGIYSEPTNVKIFTKSSFYDLKFNKISAGDSFSSGIDINGVLWSWGNNTLGQLGIGTTESTRKICKVSTPETSVFDVCCGSNFTIFCSINGIFGFGNNTYGQLGTSLKKNILTPAAIKTPSESLSKNEKGDNIIWQSLTCGNKHFAAIRSNLTKNSHNLFLAGSNEFGQIGADADVVSKHLKGITLFKNNFSDMWQNVVCGYNSTIASTFPIPVCITKTSNLNVTFKEGETTNLEVFAEGSQPLEYQWLVNESNGFEAIKSSNNSNILSVNSEGKYQCKVSNFSGTVYSDIFQVHKYCAPKIIYFSPTQQTLKLVNQENKNILLELIVSVTGIADSFTKTTNNPTTEFKFVWTLNNIPLHKEPILKKGRLLLIDQNICKATDSLKLDKNFKPGTYSCHISNKYGVTKSQNWFISDVRATKLISDFPEQIIINESEAFPTLIAHTEGEETANFQWYKNNEIMPDKTSNFLQLEEVGLYHLEIKTKNSEIKTKTVNFCVKENFEIITQPPELIETLPNSFTDNDGIFLSVSTKGFIVKNNTIEEPSFQWYKNDIAITNANTNILKLNFAENATYHCAILNTHLKTNKTKIQVISPPIILKQTENFHLIKDKKNFNKLQIDFKGDFPIKISWYNHLSSSSKKLIKRIELSQEDKYYENLSSFLDIEDTGDYSCVIENNCGRANSNIINVSEYIPASIENFEINDLTNTTKFSLNKQKGPYFANIKVNTSGSGDILYKWQVKKGKVWADLNVNEKNSNSCVVDTAGIYKCTVSNLLKTKSPKDQFQIFTIEESRPPQIIIQPKSKFVIPKLSDIKLICYISNEDEFPDDTTYQWYFNDNPIEEANSNEYLLISANAGKYYCIIENPYGASQTDNIYILHEEISSTDLFAPKELLIQKNNFFKKYGEDFFDSFIHKIQEIPLSNFKKCYAAEDRSFLIDKDGLLYGVGSNRNNELGINITPSILTNQISNKIYNNLYIKKLHNNYLNNRWKNEINSNNNLADNITNWVPLLSDVLSISAGKKHTLTITFDENLNQNILLGCGDNEYNQLGDTFDPEYPLKDFLLPGSNVWQKIILPNNEEPVAVSCGSYHSLILTKNDKVYGTGLNNVGQLAKLPIFNTNNGTIPNWIEIITDIKEISAKLNNSFVLTKNSILFGTGSNLYNQISPESDPHYYNWQSLHGYLQEVVSPPKKIIAGYNTIFYIDEQNNLYAKGLNDSNQLGVSPYNNVTPEIDFVFIKENVLDISPGEKFTLIQVNNTSFLTNNENFYTTIDQSTKILGIGNNTFGQLGDGSTQNSTTFVDSNLQIDNMSAGNFHSLVITPDLNPGATGRNQYGQTGLEETSSGSSDLLDAPPTVKEHFGNKTSWATSKKIKFLQNLSDNKLLDFQIFKDVFYIVTETGFILEKTEYLPQTQSLSLSPNYSEIIYIEPNSTNEALPSYWYDGDNFIYIAVIYPTSQSIAKTFSFVLQIYKFNIEEGSLVSIVNNVLKINYEHSINWSSNAFLIHKPLLNFCLNTKTFNISFSLCNKQTNEMGLVSINIHKEFFANKSYYFIDTLKMYMPWFININYEIISYIKPLIRLYTTTLVQLYQDLEIKSELLNNATDISYQWYKDNELLEGENLSTLIIKNLSSADLGLYELVATNLAGTVYENIQIQT